MGRLADLAKTKMLRGQVSVTDAAGATTTYATEAEAEKATSGLELEHRRGAFFAKPAPAAAPKISKKSS